MILALRTISPHSSSAWQPFKATYSSRLLAAFSFSSAHRSKTSGLIVRLYSFTSICCLLLSASMETWKVHRLRRFRKSQNSQLKLFAPLTISINSVSATAAKFSPMYIVRGNYKTHLSTSPTILTPTALLSSTGQSTRPTHLRY